MDKEDIYLGDWKRLLIGDNPWTFTLEILARTVIIYLCLVIVMRLLGKRMNAQLTNMDLAVMLTLGAIASVPMQAYDRGLLPGIILLVSILAIHRSITYIMYSKRDVEVVVEGKISCIIKDGLVDPDLLEKLRINRDQLFALLRDNGIRHLGQVKRFYSEGDGHFNVFRFKESRPGLSVLPDFNKNDVHGYIVEENLRACSYCGKLEEKENSYPVPCVRCGNKEWQQAIR